MLQPKICGQWDGHNLWLQWSPPPGAECAVRFALRRPGGDWGNWTTMPATPRCFCVIPVWREGFEAMAEVSVAGGQWERAAGATFARSRAEFLFIPEKSFSFAKGHKFGAVVDNAACVWQATEGIHLLAGIERRAELECAQPTGWAQLDHAGHFTLRAEALTVTNAGPSENDTLDTGRDYVALSRAPRVSAFHIVKK